MRGYFGFAAGNRRLVAFGFVAAFASSFGQTYFVGVFSPAIQSEFGLSHTAWGGIYMAGTLASAALLPWTGRLIDRVDLRHYTVMVCLALILACGLIFAVTGPFTLVLAIFLLRQSGQGLMSHVAITSMARYFDIGRGRAIAAASLGFSAGEAVLPLGAVLAIAAFGWRETYAGIALLLAFGLVPAILGLLKGHTRRHLRHLETLSRPLGDAGPPRPAWSVGEVLRDPRFYLLLPGLLAPPMILTAMFFHHLNLAEAKGWSDAWITGNYVVFAASTTLTALVTGPLIDRLGAVRLVPFMLLPLGLAMIAVWSVDGAWIVPPYLALAGINTGLAHTAAAAMWAEVYGVLHLGGIKSLSAALGVFGSALGPVSMGALMDLGMRIDSVCLVFGGYTVVATALLIVALNRPPAGPPA